MIQVAEYILYSRLFSWGTNFRYFQTVLAVTKICTSQEFEWVGKRRLAISCRESVMIAINA